MEINLDIPGWMGEDELKAIAHLAKFVPENSLITELGTFCGRSAWAWKNNIPKSCHLDLVDIWYVLMRNDLADHFNLAHGSSENKKLLIDLVSQYSDGSGVFHAMNTFIPDASNITKYKCDVSDYNPSEPPSLVFIDAEHTYDAVTNDIRKYIEFDETLLVGHDFASYATPVVQAVLDNMGGRRLYVFKKTTIWMLIPNNGYWLDILNRLGP